MGLIRPLEEVLLEFQLAMNRNKEFEHMEYFWPE